MNRFKASSIFSGGVIPLNNRRTLLKSYIWNYVVSNSGKATLENSIKGDIDLELIGGTEQLTTTGKNLFDIKKASDVSNYITTETLAKIDITAAIVFDVKKNTNYCLSVSGKTGQPSINFNIANDVQRKSILNKLKTEETLNSLDSGKIYVGFSGGDTELNATKLSQEYFDIQLEEASSKTPYEPYTGLKPSPSPDYPQEIKSAGRKSKNLFDINYFKDKSNLKMLQCEGFTLLGIICNVKPNTNYTLSANVTEALYNLNIANKTQRFSLTSSSARTLMSNNDGTLYIGLFNTTADAVNMDDFMQQYKNIQLEEGNTATCYEAYSDKYLLDLKVTGKNLFPYSNDFSNWKKYVNNSYFGSVTSDESGIKAEALKPYAKIVSPTFKLKPNTEYTVSAMIDTKDKAKSIGVRIFKNLNVSGYLKQIVIAARKSTNEPQKVSATFTTDDLKDANEVYLQLDCSWGDSVLPTIVTFYDIQLELGNNATNYEPYTEQTVQIALDEPLRGIGDYKDVLTKDGVVRKIAHEVGNTNCSFLDFDAEKNLYKIFFNPKYTPKNDKTYEIQCNISSNLRIHKDLTNIYWLGTSEEIQGMGIDIKGTMKDANAKLLEYLSKNPIELQYELETPVTEPLPESVQPQLSALHSHNGTTHINIDSGEVECGIKVAYKQKK